jgi:acyl-CoA synthetase (AMP-forming)/AMP-acid ligase II
VALAEDGTVADLPAGVAGELWARTPASREGDADGWVRTGDVGRIDVDGFVWIEGRVSDMVNRGGLKVYPAEVEEVLRTSPHVVDAAVVGVPDDRLGEVPWAFVIASEAAPVPLSDALSDLCRQQLAPYKIPAGFDVVDALPRNEVGKVLKAALAARAAASRKGSPG